MMLLRRALLLMPLVTTAVTASTAHAQDRSRIQGTLWAPTLSIDNDAIPHVENSRAIGRWNWNVGAVLELLERPYVTRDGGTGRFVDYQLWMHALAQIGVASNMTLGLELPVMLSQNGDATRFGQSSLGNTAFGDVRLNYRLSSHRVYGRQTGPRPESRGSDSFANEGPGFGLVVNATAPTGDARSLAGAGAFTLSASGVADFRLFGLLLNAQLGYRARLDGSWPGQGSDCSNSATLPTTASCLGSVPLHDQLTWNVGVRMPQGLLWGVASAYFEAFGAVSMRDPLRPNTQPIELGLGLQRTIGTEYTISAGATTGVTDVPGNPRVRALVTFQWAPRFQDDDGDGLRDNTGEDRCPGLPEDRDGYQDNDGCPEDNDHDSVPDEEDRCPFQDEDEDGHEDEDGCPDNDNDSDGVEDARDQCRDVAAGPNPDEQRIGCPSDDVDHDGVRNDEDQCRDAPAGAHPDPARRGCAIPDTDGDGVLDPDDACPTQAAGSGATAEQRGCPDEDPDHDGVDTEHDRCPQEMEDINGVSDDDGCIDATAAQHSAATGTASAGAPPRARVPAGRVLVRSVASTTEPAPTIVLLDSVRFTAQDAVAAASNPLLDQLARVLMATARNPSRRWTLATRTSAPTVTGSASVDAARAVRRRDAVIAALRARGVATWALAAADPLPWNSPVATAGELGGARGAREVDRGIVLRAVVTAAR